MAETLVKNNLRVHGIDLSSTMVDLSRKQVPGGTFEIVNMLEYTPPSSTTTKFNGVVAMYSLFVLSREQITRMAGNWFQWLEPGRYLLIGVIGAEDFKNTSPEKFDADGQCATGVPHMFMNNVVYVTLFTKEGWNKLLENTGFTVVHTETDLFRPPADAVCDDEPHSFVIAQKPSSAYFLFGVGYFERGRGEDGAHREVKGYKGVCEVYNHSLSLYVYTFPHLYILFINLSIGVDDIKFKSSIIVHGWPIFINTQIFQRDTETTIYTYTQLYRNLH